jgi:hypothetical protein
MQTIREFFEFLKENKKWVLAPVILVLVFIGFLLVMTQGTVVAPFVYTLF